MPDSYAEFLIWVQEDFLQSILRNIFAVILFWVLTFMEYTPVAKSENHLCNKKGCN